MAAFGPWIVERPIGRGATATVWRCRHVDAPERRAAVKVLPGRDPADVARLAREARLLRRLDHPGIVRVLDAGLEGDAPWLALELVDGRPLDEARPGARPADEVLVLGAALADALAHAHGLGVWHRDVKPANVLVDRAGRARLVDFGVAATAEDPDPARAGTWPYLPPEGLDRAPAPAAADAYALGVVLHEQLTGGPAFPRDPDAARRAKAGPLDPGEAVPAVLRGVITRLTAPDRVVGAARSGRARGARRGVGVRGRVRARRGRGGARAAGDRRAPAARRAEPRRGAARGRGVRAAPHGARPRPAPARGPRRRAGAAPPARDVLRRARRGRDPVAPADGGGGRQRARRLPLGRGAGRGRARAPHRRGARRGRVPPGADPAGARAGGAGARAAGRPAARPAAAADPPRRPARAAGRIEASLAEAEAAVAEARAHGDPLWEGRTVAALARVGWMQRDPAATRALLADALARLDGRARPREVALLRALRANIAHALRTGLDEAVADAEAAVRGLEEDPDPYALVMVLGIRALVTGASLDPVIALARRNGYEALHTDALCMAGIEASRAGRLDEARTLLERARDGARRGGFVGRQADAAGGLVSVALKQRRFAEAERWAREGMALRGETDERAHPNVANQLGLACAGLGRLDEAERWFARADARVAGLPGSLAVVILAARATVLAELGHRARAEVALRAAEGRAGEAPPGSAAGRALAEARARLGTSPGG